MSSQHRRLRALAGPTRARLMALLRQAEQPMRVDELAALVGLHANTVREQLEELLAVGLVTRTPAAPLGRGRPAMSYAASSAEPDGDGSPYRALARVLAEQLGRQPGATPAAVDAGERWGRSLAEGAPPATDEATAVDALVGLLDDAGFAPERPTAPTAPIRLRACPFGTLARDHREVVCGVHLGLMRGALRAIGAPLDAVRLEPFVAADLCVAHLARRADD